MASELAKQLEAKIASVRAHASRQKENAKAEGIELLYDVGAAVVGGGVGALEGAEKMTETFKAFGYDVPTKLTIALGAKAAAFAFKGQGRKFFQETSRGFTIMQTYSSGKEAAAKKLAEDKAKG